MNILVTGGTGFIGSHITKALVQEGHKVFVTGVPSCEEQLPEGVMAFPHGPMGINWDYLQKSLKGSLHVLFHQAANNDTTWDDDIEMEFDNVESSCQVFQKCVELGCRKIVYASSTAIYGNTPAPHKEASPTKPLNAYARSKLYLEQVAEVFAAGNPDVVLIGLRYCNVYGPGENKKGKRASMIYQMGKAIQYRPVKLFEHGEQKRDYIFVEDVVRANLLAMEYGESCVVNCGSGVATTFNRLYEILADVLARPNWGGPVYIRNPYEGKYQDHTQCDMTAADEILGFRPKYDIEKGIKEYHARGGFR